MIYFALGFSLALNLFLILLGIFIYKKTNVSDKLVKQLEETKTDKKTDSEFWNRTI